MKHIPNLLSTFRILLIGVFCYLFLNRQIPEPVNYWWAMAVYVLAFLTDVLDGYLARTFHWVTPLGKILDPLADKLMTIAALICILIGKVRMHTRVVFYFVLFALAALKELLMIVGGMLMLKRKRVAFADWYGKVAMGVFAAGIVLSLMSFPVPRLEPWNLVVLTVALVLSFISMGHYAKTQLFAAATAEGGEVVGQTGLNETGDGNKRKSEK